MTFFHFMQQEFVRQYRASGVPEQGAGAEAWEGGWDDEKTPNERYESDAVDPAVDPDRCRDANGGSGGGGGNLSTAKKWCSGARHFSHPASKRKAGQDGSGGTLVKEDGEQDKFRGKGKISQGKDPSTFKGTGHQAKR